MEALRCDASAGSWRTVEVSSLDGRPFAVELRWAAGAGPPRRPVLLEFAGDGRICLFARFIAVRLANRSDKADNRVQVAVIDGGLPTRNVTIVHGSGPGVVSPPPFARSVRLETGYLGDLGTSTLTVLDGTGSARAQHPGAAQPVGGTTLGAASAVQVAAPQSADWRLVFELGL